MDTTPELNQAVTDWQSAAQRVIDAARRGAQVSVRTLDAGLFPSGADPEAAVRDFLDASGRILAALPDFSVQESLFPPTAPVEDEQTEPGAPEESLRIMEPDAGFLAEESGEPLDRTIKPEESPEEPGELDAADRALALFAGSLSVVDVLLGAAESPSTIRAEYHLTSLAEYGEDAHTEIRRFAQVINGGAAVAAMDPPTTLPGELHRLGDSAGTETVALATFGIGAKELPSLMGALEHLVDSSKDGVREIAVILALKGFVNKMKREAAKILQWFLERVRRVLPPGIERVVEHLVNSRQFDFLKPGHIVGEVELAVFGAGDLIAQWNGLDSKKRPQIADSLIEPSLEHIRWITQGRRAIGTFGTRLVLLFAHANPAVAIAYYAVVAVAIAFVVAQAGFGVRALGVPMAGV